MTDEEVREIVGEQDWATFLDTLAKVRADLLIQSMLFDMPIDWETMSLAEPSKAEPVPQWAVRWREKEASGDFDTQFDIDNERENYDR